MSRGGVGSRVPIDASVGTEELAHMEVVSAILYQLTKNLSTDESGDLFAKLDFGVPEFEYPVHNTKESVLTFLHEDMVAEQKAQCLYDTILSNVHDIEVSDPIRFLRAREIVHYQRLGEAIQIVQGKNWKE